MKPSPKAFTLIEVMLAVAIFAFAVVGFGVALNDVLGVNSEILRTAQRRQALESAAAQVLALSNNLTQTPLAPLPGWGSEKTWTLWLGVQPARADVPGPNNTVLSLGGWWRVDLEARDYTGQPVDRLALILYGTR